MWNISRLLQELKEHKFILLSFVLSALIIALVAPSTKGFQYQFSLGRPWQHDLLMAPYDFPIYKTDTEIKRGQDSIRAAHRPVYVYERTTGEQMLSELADEYRTHLKDEIPARYYNYAHAKLTDLYHRGLMQADELSELRNQGKLELQLRQGEVLERKPITQFYTLREGYELLFEALPQNIDRQVLEQMDLVRFLSENVVYDEHTDQQLLTEALGRLSPSTGLIQQGERIVDRGEIITPELYNVLRSLEIEHEHRSGGTLQHQAIRIGVFVTMSLLLTLLGLYILLLIPGFDHTIKNWLLIQTFSLGFIVLTALNAHYDLFSVHIIPYVMLVILWRIFFNGYTSLVSFIAVVLASAVFVAEPLSFILIQMLGGLAALISMQRLSSRGQMIKASFIVYLTYTVASIGITLISVGSFSASYWIIQVHFAINLVFLMFTYVLAFIVERAFGYVSSVSLVELSDINTPLLKELSQVAPGTFQHSLHVSILAAEAATLVGGDVSLIRTGALYHDIGKMKNPAYFTENQGGSNPHDLLSPEESAAVILRHVTDGIALAQKHNLPNQIIDFIRTHHGRSMTRYFYTISCNAHPDVEIDPAPYTYPGPNPWTKEQGILMLADAVEASTRSLGEYTEERITQHVSRIIDSIVAEGFLSDTPITFRDLQTIKDAFSSILKTVYHTRISYPDKQ